MNSLNNTALHFKQSLSDTVWCTPTITVAERILDKKINTLDEVILAAQSFIDLGCKNVILQIGCFKGKWLAYDFYTNGTESFWLTSLAYKNRDAPYLTKIFSLLLTKLIAFGHEFKDAIVIAKMYINRANRLALTLDDDSPLIQITDWPEDEIDLPYLSNFPLDKLPKPFPDCGLEPLGLYPVVDSSEWIEQLLPLGIKTIQLRLKNKSSHELDLEIKKSVLLAKTFNARLFVNDYWELAMAHGAYGVHLGQEDLLTADKGRLHQAGLRLGVSTHCYYEVARAHAFRPSYMACGPIFPTTSKSMPFTPQGIFNLQRWCNTLKNYRLIAIGGINAEKIPPVMATGVDGVALISAITQSKQPEEQTKKLLELINLELVG